MKSLIATLEAAKGEMSGKLKNLEGEKIALNSKITLLETDNKELKSKKSTTNPSAVVTGGQQQQEMVISKLQKELESVKKEKEDVNKSLKNAEKEKASVKKQSDELEKKMKKDLNSIRKEKDTLSSSFKVVEKDLKKWLKDVQPKKVSFSIIITLGPLSSSVYVGNTVINVGNQIQTLF